MGLMRCFCKCCNCFNYFCETCALVIYSLSVFALSCCCLGMAIGSLFFVIYYASFFPSTPSVTLENAGMYDYLHENSDFKREVSHDADESDDFSDQYYDDSEAGSDYMFRNKRNFTEADPSSAVSTNLMNTEHSRPNPVASQSIDPFSFLNVTSTSQQSTEDVYSTEETSTTKKRKSLFGRTTTTTTYAPETVEYDPDFQLANVIMDSIYTHAEKANLKVQLGLCRQAADVQVSEFTGIIFPPDEANEILHCINDLLHNQTKKQLCIQLDAEMNAYLKWLILTGEPRERRKPTSSGPHPDSFLFPTSECGKQPPLDQPQCLVDHGFNKHLEKRHENYDQE